MQQPKLDAGIAPVSTPLPSAPAGPRATPSLRAGLLIAVVAATAAPVLLAIGSSIPRVDALALLVLLGLVALAEVGELELFDRTSFSVGPAPIVAGVLLLGLPGAAVAASVPLLRGLRRGTCWYKVVFNVAAHVLAAGAGWAAASCVVVPLDTSHLPLLLVPTGLAGTAFYLANTSLTAVAMAVDLRLSPVRVWVDNFRWLGPQYLALSLMGLLLAVAQHDYGLVGVAAFVLPPLMMRYVAKQYVDRTQANMRQLRALNQELAEEVRRREQSERTLQHQALHDVLTGLPNRTLLADRLQQALAASRRDGRPLALLLLDLDRFKEVNDTFGHPQGDRVLQEISRRLQGALRESDTVARLGGDEFAVLLPGAEAAGAEAAARALLGVLEQPLVVEGRVVEVGGSIGIALAPAQGQDPATLLRRADVAMYAAKRAGTGQAVYAPEQDQHSPDRLALVADLRRALEHDELVLHYQPKVDLRTTRVTGVEALVRWQHPERGLVAPGEFIAVAEETGLIRPLGEWVLDAALQQCRAWEDAGHALSVAVNLSMRNLHDEGLPELVAERLAVWGVRPAALVIEITESTLMADPDRALAILRRLSGLGVQIAIDDFGTGYSSLSYLNQLPVSELKIDRSFVQYMATRPGEATIVRSTIGLAHDLGLTVVAEGIEDQPTWDLLAELGCELVQGYYISRPMPAADLARWLAEAARQGPLTAAA